MRLQLLSGLLLSLISTSGAAASDGEELFARHVWPLLQTRCIVCHGKDGQVKGGYDLTRLETAVRGGDSLERAIVPGRPEESPLYLAITCESDVWSPMPPKENDRLTREQIKWVRQWITAGAPWPDEQRTAEIRSTSKIAGGEIAVSEIRGEDDAWSNRTYAKEDLWAYSPI